MIENLMIKNWFKKNCRTWNDKKTYHFKFDPANSEKFFYLLHQNGCRSILSRLQSNWMRLEITIPPSTYLNPEFLRLSDDCWMAGGRLSDGRRRRMCRQRRRKKSIWSRRPRLAASIKCCGRPFRGGVWVGFVPPSQKTGGLGSSAPQPNFEKFSKDFEFR